MMCNVVMVVENCAYNTYIPPFFLPLYGKNGDLFGVEVFTNFVLTKLA